MANAKNYKAIIVEGEEREPRILKNLQSIFFKNDNIEIITLPAGKSIYMLWKQMESDDFETDIIEVLRESSPEIERILEGKGREDFSEVFLFFDYDGHQTNLPNDDKAVDVIEQMLFRFDNETENGKLYISYPMVEALRDFKADTCGCLENCFCLIEDFGKYKNISALRAYVADCARYTYPNWKELINVFAMKVSCLFCMKQIMPFEEYREIVSPINVYMAQKQNIIEAKVFILSAFPEFLLDYFNIKFWNSCIVHTRMLSESCNKS